MFKEEAVEELKKSPFNKDTISDDITFVANKLDIDVEELMHYHKMDKKWWFDYKNEKKVFDLGAKVLQFFKLEFSIKR